MRRSRAIVLLASRKLPQPVPQGSQGLVDGRLDGPLGALHCGRRLLDGQVLEKPQDDRLPASRLPRRAASSVSSSASASTPVASSFTVALVAPVGKYVPTFVYRFSGAVDATPERVDASRDRERAVRWTAADRSLTVAA